MRTATKSDLLGLVDYLQDSTYALEGADWTDYNGELSDIKEWVQRCVVWLYQEANKMNETTTTIENEWWDAIK